MEQKEHHFIENQFKAAGLSDAFTPELVAQLNLGLPNIKHPFDKIYDRDPIHAGDEVKSILHLNKAVDSDKYFLNKMDLDLKKEGQEQHIKQSFHLTERRSKNERAAEEKENPSQKYTFKKAYNLLAGRPVYDHVNESWNVMNQKKYLSNGDHKIDHYSKNYGFKLDDVLSKHSIVENFKDSLKEGLERGNLQKAIFTDKDGKDLPLYVTPNITAGTLDVYDLDKQKIPTERLLQEGLIDKGLGEKLIHHQNEKRTAELKENSPKITDTEAKSKIKDEVTQHPKEVLKAEKPKQRQKIN